MLDAGLIGLQWSRMEFAVGRGRLDLAFESSHGLTVVECKVQALADDDVRQLCRYLDDLQSRSVRVCKAYLVGHTPSSGLNPELLMHPPGIQLRYLFQDIPAHLAFCDGRHYFDVFIETCPYCGEPPIPGKDLTLQF